MANRRNGAAIAEDEERPVQQVGIVATARRVDIEKRESDGYRRKAKAEVWQSESYTFFDLLGEVKQPTYYIANTCSLARLYIATRPDPEQDPSAPAPGTPGLFEAEDALERLRQGARGGTGGLTRSFVLNAKLAGECYLVGVPPQDEIPPGGKDENGNVYKDGRAAQPELWRIMSVSQVESKGEGRSQFWTYRDEPGEEPKRFPSNTYVWRIWQEHPEFPELADCAMRALLPICEELLILTRMVKAVGRSRLATAGILAIASELDPTPATQPGTDGEEPKRFIDDLMDAAETNILNEGSASAVVPIIVRGPHDMIKDGIVFTEIARHLDPLALEQRKELIQRMGQGSDVPMEILVGLRNLSHWTSFLVDQSTWDRYAHPTMLLWAESLSVGYLHDMMAEAGVAPEVARNFLVWFDPGGAVVQPDRTATVMAALDRFLISWDTARTILGFAETDAPTDHEIAQRIQIMVAMKGGPKDGGDGTAGPTGDAAPNNGNPADSPNATTRTTDPLLLLKSYMDANDGALPPALVAAARQRRQPLGRRLMGIDRTLRMRLVEAADAAMLRALERAGARVRNRAKRTATVTAAVPGDIAAWQVPSRLGPAIVASLGFSDDELLADGFDDLEPKFLDRVAKAQGSALDAMAADLGLDEGEIDAIRMAQQRDRSDAWAWLSGALLALGHERLYSPAPEAPAKGEFDADSRVPVGILREAMARAGGAAGTVTADGTPVGGVALGQLVLDTFARHGQVTRGWRWVYGDPSSRTTGFEPHEALDAEEFATWADPVLANHESFPDAEFFRPGDHMWCFPAGTEVSGPAARGATLRWYEGELVELAFASGQFLSATPNHPILTRRGWVAAGALVEGDEVIRCEGADRVAGLVPDDRQVPALIEDVVAAVGVAPNMNARCVPVPAEQFHGDGKGSEVAVVWTDGLLRDGAKAAFSEPGAEDALVGADTFKVALTGQRGAGVSLVAVGVSPLGGVRSSSHGFAFSGSHLTEPQDKGLALSAPDNASGVEVAVDGSTGDVESSREGGDGLAFFVEAAQQGVVDYDRIIGLRTTLVARHVFNLQTATGWYLANGIVVHNCQCDFEPLGLGSDEQDEADDGETADAAA